MKASTIFTIIALSAITMLPTVARNAAMAAGAKTPAELVAKYKQAHNTKNLPAMKALCYWGGVSTSDKNMIEQAELGRFAMPLTSIKFRSDNNHNKPLTIPIQGKNVPLNLPLAGYLDTQFSGSKIVQMGSAQGRETNPTQTYWIGKKHGAYYIAFLSEKD